MGFMLSNVVRIQIHAVYGFMCGTLNSERIPCHRGVVGIQRRKRKRTRTVSFPMLLNMSVKMPKHESVRREQTEFDLELCSH